MKTSQAFKIVMALALAALLIAGGCAKPVSTATTTPPVTAPTTSVAPTTKPTSTTTTAAGPYGELKIAYSTFGTDTLDPVTGGTYDSNILQSPIFNDLIMVKGTALTAEGALLESWEMAPDGLSWLYKIRKGIKFHNGDALTAQDVKFSIDRYLIPQAFYSDSRLAIDRTEIVDDYSVRIFGKGTQIYLPYLHTPFTPTQGLVQPKEYIEKNGLGNFKLNPVGTGPWKFVKMVPGDFIKYEANMDYWHQKPDFKTLVTMQIPEQTTRVALLKTGAIDAADIDMESAPELESLGFKAHNLESGRVIALIEGAYTQQALAAKMPITDVRVRQALSLAINRDEINKNLFQGKAGPPPPPYMWSQMADMDSAYWMDYAKKAFRYDLDEAKRLLQEAGYGNGFNLTLYSTTQLGAGFIPDVVLILQNYWSRIGVKVQVVPRDWAQLKTVRNTLKFPDLIGQVYLDSSTGSPVTPKNLVTSFHSAGTTALVGTAMPELDKLIDSLYTTPDAAQRKANLDKALKMVTDAYVALVIADVPVLGATSTKIDISFNKPTMAMPIYANLVKHAK